MVLKTAIDFYKRYERHISSIFLLGGFVFDVLTLRRADTFWENFWIIVHLLMAAAAMLLLIRVNKREKIFDAEFDFWMVNVLQFSFGGLLAAFFILYFRSATLSVSWPFLLLLLSAFVANERFKKGNERIIYQAFYLFLTLFLFLIFFIPVLFGIIGPSMFIIAGLASLFIFRLFIGVLIFISKDRIGKSLNKIRLVVLGTFAMMNLLYFTHIIPPIPLSLREAGVYHTVDKDVSGDYILRGERKNPLDFFRNQVIHVIPGESIFAFNAVFSPAKFNTKIIHEWQKQNDGGNWETVSRIDLPTRGGRDGGYRTFSFIKIIPGKWRVNILTDKGQILGRIRFKALEVSSLPELVTDLN